MPTNPENNKGRKTRREIWPRIAGTFFRVTAKASRMFSTTAWLGGNTKLSMGTAMIEKAQPVKARTTEASSMVVTSHSSATVEISPMHKLNAHGVSETIRHGDAL